MFRVCGVFCLRRVVFACDGVCVCVCVCVSVCVCLFCLALPFAGCFVFAIRVVSHVCCLRLSWFAVRFSCVERFVCDALVCGVFLFLGYFVCVVASVCFVCGVFRLRCSMIVVFRVFLLVFCL